MKELTTKDSLFLLPENRWQAAAFTTNGQVRRNGDAVCGAGIAKQAENAFHIEPKLGQYLRLYGNRAFYLGVFSMGSHELSLVSFPTKHHWNDDSDTELIRKSAQELMVIADKFHLTHIYCPRPGCQCGHLKYEIVGPILQSILDDRFIIVLRDN